MVTKVESLLITKMDQFYRKQILQRNIFYIRVHPVFNESSLTQLLPLKHVPILHYNSRINSMPLQCY